MTDSEAAEFYRDKLVDWMIAHDIATGGGDQAFDALLEVISAYIKAMQE